MNTLAIALNGLTPGAAPITIASQGLLITIEQPEEQQDAAWIPLRSFGPPNSEIYDSRKGKKKRVDCVVDVEGVRGTLTCTKADVHQLAVEAKIVPILAEYCLRYWRWKKRCAAKAEPQTKAARDKIAAATKEDRKVARQLASFQLRSKGKKTSDLAESIFWRDRQIAELHEQMAKLLLEKTL
jgi:hypothetical protein